MLNDRMILLKRENVLNYIISYLQASIFEMIWWLMSVVLNESEVTKPARDNLSQLGDGWAPTSAASDI